MTADRAVTVTLPGQTRTGAEDERFRLVACQLILFNATAGMECAQFAYCLRSPREI
jgi:hypothetical protein